MLTRELFLQRKYGLIDERLFYHKLPTALMGDVAVIVLVGALIFAQIWNQF